MNKNTIVWITLLLMTLMSYFFSSTAWGKYTFIGLSTIIIIKCSMVGFGFMELRDAHKFWQVAFLFLVVAFSLFVMAVTMAGL